MDRNPFRAKRISSELAKKSMVQSLKKEPSARPYLITDNPEIDITDTIQFLDIPQLQKIIETHGEAIYVLGFEQDDKCVDVMRLLKDSGKPFFPCLQYYPTAEYWRTNRIAQAALALEYDEQTSKPEHKWNTDDFVNITQAIQATSHLPGAYLEVGVFKGNSARLALQFLRQAGIRRRSFFMDVFIGFNYPEAESSVDTIWQGTHVVGPTEIIEEQLRPYSDSTFDIDIHVLQNNIISDDLPDGLEEIAVANLDVDMYEAVAAGLEKISPRLVNGGILIVEDPGHTPALSGARLALDDFLSTSFARDNFVPVNMTSGQTFLIRRS